MSAQKVAAEAQSPVEPSRPDHHLAPYHAVISRWGIAPRCRSGALRAFTQNTVPDGHEGDPIDGDALTQPGGAGRRRRAQNVLRLIPELRAGWPAVDDPRLAQKRVARARFVRDRARMRCQMASLANIGRNEKPQVTGTIWGYADPVDKCRTSFASRGSWVRVPSSPLL